MLLACAVVLHQTVTLRPGIVITRSCVVMGGQATMPSGAGSAVVVQGDGLTVDFRGTTMLGSPVTIDPDKRSGTGLVIKGTGVTVKGLKARGYMVAIRAEGAHGLKLIDCDVSFNWKQRLGSTQDREDSADWMSYHQNEKDEWLRYGAGIYLRDCDKFEVRGCTAIGGQNGLMLTGCDGGVVWNSNFSFLSSLGIGMYRCNDNRVMHNNIDWCVRGYSHGVYNRGQDSAGILVYEQSNRNVFAYNSVTHGGDGFFLWAGQTTMDNGQGGCNDNLLYANDFSHAPTNGIEATFSRNVFSGNLIMECWHGIWGGYSYDTKIVGNVFALNGDAVAIEHGQDNTIRGNVFRGDHNVFHLWANPSQDPNWGYPKSRDTKSRDYTIDQNHVLEVSGSVFDINRTSRVMARDNTFKRFGTLFKLGPEVSGMELDRTVVWSDKAVDIESLAPALHVGEWTARVSASDGAPKVWMQPSGLVSPGADDDPKYLGLIREPWPGMSKPRPLTRGLQDSTPAEIREANALEYHVKPMAGGYNPFQNVPLDRRGRKHILVDQWGPYDFLSPRLWPERGSDAGTQKFKVLGPAGAWRVKTLSEGVRLSSPAGLVPGEVTATFAPGSVQDVEIVLVYTGAKTIDYRGIVTAAGKPVGFGYRQFVVPIDWTISHWNYDKDREDPRTAGGAFSAVLARKPDATYKAGDLNGAWGGSPRQGVDADYFATLAAGNFSIRPGEYEIVVTSDDGVRVRLDGQVILDDWTYHGPKTESIPVKLGGPHALQVEHFELNGYSALKLEIRKKG